MSTIYGISGTQKKAGSSSSPGFVTFRKKKIQNVSLIDQLINSLARTSTMD